MTNHFKISLSLLLVASLAVFGGYEWLSHRIAGALPDVSGTAYVLPKNDKELVTYNNKTHTLIIVTSSGTTKEYADNPTVEIRKNGDVVVARHLIGFEMAPFLGLGYAGQPTAFIGADVFHLGRFDLHGEIGLDKSSIKMYTGIGYQFWSNTSLNVSVNPIGIATARPDIALFVSVRF